MVGIFVTTNINTQGGIWLSINQLLGNEKSVSTIYNKSGNSNHVWVTVKGVKSNNRQEINDRFFLIAEPSIGRFVVENSTGIYETKTQIITKRLKAEAGRSATIREQAIAFNDEAIVPKLWEIYSANENSSIYLTGTLEVDAPEEIQAIANPDRLTTIEVTGNSLKLYYANLIEVGKISNNQWAKGSLTARIIYPKPDYGQMGVAANR